MSDRPFAIPVTPTFTTPAALDALHAGDVAAALARHFAGDWGELCPDDRAENERAVRADGLRLFSVYRDRHGTCFYVITEADRSATTVLLPEDY